MNNPFCTASFCLKRFLGWLALMTLLLVGVLWWWVMQPLFGNRFVQSVQFVQSARLKAHVRYLTGPCFPRDYLHPANLDEAADYIRHQFEVAKGRIAEQIFEVEGRKYRNISAFFGPKTADRIVVGAHYDAFGPLPGADDNASGVAGLMELAFLLSSQALGCEVELVAYSLEEPPFFKTPAMGSAVHAAALKKQGVSLRAMLAMEMIGYFEDAPESQEYPLGLLEWFYPGQGNYIAVVGVLSQGMLVRKVKRSMQTASPLPVWSMNAPRWVPGIDFSDHLNYWNQGYPAVMVTDTAFNRNQNYHKRTDTPETLDYSRMAWVVQGVGRAVVDLAKAK